MLIRPLLLALAALTFTAFAADAACYADYKASRDNPLKLHYGVIKIDTNPCAMSEQAKRQVARRLGAAGWKLLQLGSVFDDSGLAQRKKDAGQYFLRF